MRRNLQKSGPTGGSKIFSRKRLWVLIGSLGKRGQGNTCVLRKQIRQSAQAIALLRVTVVIERENQITRGLLPHRC